MNASKSSFYTEILQLWGRDTHIGVYKAEARIAEHFLLQIYVV